MTEDEAADRLSKISTQWPELVQAHSASLRAVTAQAALLGRYSGAVYYYLLASTKDPHTAEELSQEFALRFVRGDFHRADPQRGRFRDFIKTVLRNLVADYYRQRRGEPAELPPDSAFIPASGVASGQADADFTACWRQQLLDRTWEELQLANERAGQPYYAVLRWKAENPDGTAQAGANELCRRLAREVSPAAFRQMLHRAREAFAGLLLQEVARSLGSDESNALAQELADLELLVYCRPVLERVERSA